jgi:hypothetical protein
VPQVAWLWPPECDVLTSKPIQEDNFFNLSSYARPVVPQRRYKLVFTEGGGPSDLCGVQL